VNPRRASSCPNVAITERDTGVPVADDKNTHTDCMATQ